MSVIVGGIYKHYKKRTNYKVIAIGKYTETLELMVVYEALYDNPESKIWIRPLEMFDGVVEENGQIIKRFQLVEKTV